MTVALSKLNFRDVGGLRAVDGRVIRPNLIFRSEGPANFMAAHHEELEAIGFKTICDLRSAIEREEAPNDWAGPDCRMLHLDINIDIRAQGEESDPADEHDWGDLWGSLRNDPTAERAHWVMSESYRHMPAALLPNMKLIVQSLIDGDVPMMIHCTAGKDRTGVSVGLLLLLAGVGHDDVIADYQRSVIFGENMWVTGAIEVGFNKMFGFMPDRDVVDATTGVNPDYLESALAEVRKRWGTVADYFTAAGVDNAMQARLREAMLEPARADTSAN